MEKRIVGFAAALLLTLTTAQVGWSQESRGSIAGRVTDTSGAVVPSVSVRITNVATGVTTTAAANEEGLYVVRYLIPGLYRIEAEKPGFKRVLREGIELRINDELEVDLALSVGELTETVTVTSYVPPLESTDASYGQVVDSRRVAELPLPYDNPNLLMKLSPAVNVTGNVMQDQPWEPLNTTQYTMGGTPSTSGEYSMDGSSNSYTDNGNFAVSPAWTAPADAVAEMKIQTATFDATTGQTMGPVINVSLKSGTNTLHGSGYWSGMPTPLTANDFFANEIGASRPPTNLDRLGGSLNGPVFIPKLYDGRNRTFFMWAYEHVHSTAPRGQTMTVPTAAEINGDFSSLLSVGSIYQIYDPLTRQAAANGRFVESPFPGNIIPASRINPIATKLLSYYAPPNVPGTDDGSNNLAEPNEPERLSYYSDVIRIDHNISDKHRIYGRWNTSNRTSTLDDWFHDDASGMYFQYISTGGSFDDVYTFSPSFMMDIRVSDARFVRHADNLPSSFGFDITKLGFPASTASLIPASDQRFPHIQIAGEWDLGIEDLWDNGTLWRPEDTRQAMVSLEKLHGSHDFKFGGEFRDYMKNQYNNPYDSHITEVFGSTYTQGPYDNSPAAPLGQGLASLLLGIPTGGNFQVVDSLAESSKMWGAYFQDNWKVTQHLTLNVGLRYELETPLTERYNRSVRGFDSTATLPITTQAQANYAQNPVPGLSASQFQVLGGLTFAGVGGQPRTLYNSEDTNFAPRVGFAYSLGSKTVIRGGYGIYYGAMGERTGNDVIQTGFSQSTPLVPSLNGGLTFTSTLANPFPNGVLQPIRSSEGTATNLGNSVTYFNPNPKAALNQLYQFSLQRALPRGFVAEVSYLGSRADDIQTYRNLGALPDSYLSTSPVRDPTTINFLSANIPSPFTNLLPGTSLGGSVISQQQLLDHYPQFTSVNTTTNEGLSWYNALNLRTEKRMSHGVTVQASYTWSKLEQATSFLNPADAAPVKSISPQDFPNHVQLSWIYELPFGHGRPFLSRIPWLPNVIVGGWQVAGSFMFQSGHPLGFGDAILTGESLALPGDQRSIYKWFNTAAFNTNPSQQLADNLVTLSPYFASVRSPGYNTWDMSFMKDTQIRERLKLQLRADFLNAFNHPNFNGPDTNPTDSSFGMITSSSIFPRRIQLNAKIVF